MAFKVGDKIEWFSQSGGTGKRKTGEVIAVLAPGERPTNVYNCGHGRDHESYVIKAAKGRVYWPHVRYLKAVV